MDYEINFHNRRSIRLKDYDYSLPGLYFITICTEKQISLFGKIYNGDISLNKAGLMVLEEWGKLNKRFNNIKLHEFVVMPNHMHGILEILPCGVENKFIDKGSGLYLGEIIGAFKSITTNLYIKNVKESKWPWFDKRLWQRNYYEHVIRSEESFIELSEYIKNNPLKWELDRFYKP